MPIDKKAANALPLPKPMKQADKPIMQYDPRRAKQEQSKPVIPDLKKFLGGKK